jgi:hypothetical protein
MGSGTLWHSLELPLQTHSTWRAAQSPSPFWTQRLRDWNNFMTPSLLAGFWRLAAAGKSPFTVPENHFKCAVGAYTHNLLHH